MKKKQLLFIATLIFINTAANSQITKGNWMVGGNANFSSSRYSNSVAASYTQINLQISPLAGYFFINKLAAGLRPGYTYVKTTNGTTNLSYNTFSIGPFVRYYFLHPESKVNIFSEANYSHVISKAQNNPSTYYNGYSILAGPVVYFNSCVGIEFTVGYSFYKYGGDANSKNNTVQVGVGLQIHLEKTNK